MTYREKLMQEHPEQVSETYIGGCLGCPSDISFPGAPGCVHNCRECWDREIPEPEKTDLPKTVAELMDLFGRTICEVVEKNGYVKPITAEWKKQSRIFFDIYECSHCGSTTTFEGYNYCYNCGAKMSMEEKDEKK